MRPQLKTLVAEAAQALSALKAERLEDLARTCQALNREWSLDTKQTLAHELSAARNEMAALANVLEVTRANAAVMERIRVMRTNRLEYTVVPSPDSILREDVHGLD